MPLAVTWCRCHQMPLSPPLSSWQQKLNYYLPLSTVRLSWQRVANENRDFILYLRPYPNNYKSPLCVPLSLTCLVLSVFSLPLHICIFFLLPWTSIINLKITSLILPGTSFINWKLSEQLSYFINLSLS